MTNEKILATIEKLSRLTVARGATEAEAAVAREKIATLRKQLTVTTKKTMVYYDSVTPDYYDTYPLSARDQKVWYDLVDEIYRKNHAPPPKRK